MPYATLLVHLECGQSNARLLQAVKELCNPKPARIIGVAACRPLQLDYGDGFVTGELVDSDRREIDEEQKAAGEELRQALEGFGEQLLFRPAVVYGPLSEHVAAEARGADLVITSARPAPLFNGTRRADVGEMVLQAGRPVLVVPATGGDVSLARILVAWKDTREARRAALDALPLLHRAKQVAVAEVAEAVALAGAKERVAEVCGWLARHGIAAEPLALPRSGEDAGRLEGLAREWKADVVVAGAYGHSRLREFVLGGVTRDLLLASRRCALLSH
jgi:nucleotide-binding universal stress UspA family protein